MIPALAVLGYSLGQLAIGIIVAVVVIGILLIAVRAAEIPIPPWVWKIIWLVVLAVVAIVAIRFVMSL